MFDYALAKIYDSLMAGAERNGLQSWRKSLLADAAGDVLEIGAGTGANLQYYSDAVNRLVLAEPSRHMRAILQTKLGSMTRVAEVCGCPAEQLPFEDSSFDCVVTTLVLCTVRSQKDTLCELLRVLRPGGKLFFIEHVIAEPGTWLARFQKILQPLWRIPSCNCHLARNTEQAICAVGFVFEDLRHLSMASAPVLVRRCIWGTAAKV